MRPIPRPSVKRFQAWLASQEQVGRIFTPDQLAWLARIRDHVATSLTIGPDDFEFEPFVDRGGFGRANEAFDGQLGQVLTELNEVLAGVRSRQLPVGWAEVRLADVAEVRLGRQRSPSKAFGERMRPYVRAANVGWEGLKLDDVLEMAFTERESEAYELRLGDLLLSEASGSPGEVGKPALWKGEIPGCCFQNTLIRVRPREVSSEYLLHFFRAQALDGAFARGSRGVGIHHLGAAALTDWPILVPPVDEQRRIVLAIESAMSQLEAGRGYLDAAAKRLARMRSAVIARATSRDWPTERLGSLLREPLRNGVSAPRSQSGVGTPTLTLTAVTKGDFSAKNVKITSASPERVGDLWLETGDLLVQRSNTPELVGTARAYRGPSNFAIFPDLLIRVASTRGFGGNGRSSYLGPNLHAGTSRSALGASPAACPRSAKEPSKTSLCLFHLLISRTKCSTTVESR